MNASKVLRSIKNINDLLHSLKSKPSNVIPLNGRHKTPKNYDFKRYLDTMKDSRKGNLVLRMRDVFPTIAQEIQAFSNSESALETFLQNKEYAKLDWFYSNLKKITDNHRMLMIKSYYERTSEAKVYHFMQELDQPNLIALRYYIETCIKTKKYGAAVYAIETFESQHKKVPAKYKERLLDVCLSVYSYGAAIRVLRNLIHRYEDVFCKIAYHGQINQAWKVYQMIKDDNQYLGIHAKSALLHIKVQQGFEFWLPYWMQIRHSTTPWIKTLDQMILDCKKQNLNEIVEEVVPKDPDFPAPVPSLVSKDVIYSYFY